MFFTISVVHNTCFWRKKVAASNGDGDVYALFFFYVFINVKYKKKIVQTHNIHIGSGKLICWEIRNFSDGSVLMWPAKSLCNL